MTLLKVFKKVINLIKCLKEPDYNIEDFGKNKKDIVCFMSNMEKIYNKLVRDNIPDIIEKDGENVVYPLLETANYERTLGSNSTI